MKRYGLIGRSISNSLSPQIHKCIMQKLGVEGSYQLLEWDESHEKIRGLFELDWDGFNVTIPYKQWIIPYLDELDHSACIAGAVNTVKRNGDKWKGYNTDGDGFITSVASQFKTSHRIAVMGTGGAAFGIVSALVYHGYSNVVNVGRTNQSGDLLKQHLEKVLSYSIETITYDGFHPKDYDVLINSTSVGMIGADQAPLFHYSSIEKRHIVVDIVYKPRMTAMLLAAREKGATLIGGLDMLMAQAVLAQAIWQDKHLAYQAFRKSILEEVEGETSEL